MLIALRIENFAIIDSLEIRFGKGLNVLTGETGAGKSILFDALSLLLGGKADPRKIRAGAKEAVVEGLFLDEALAARARDLGLSGEGDEVLVRRTIARKGRGRIHVNGGLATVALLGDLLRGTVDLSGQHEHLSLLQRSRHGDLLDRHGGNQEILAQFAAAHDAWAALERERAKVEEEEAEREQRKDFLAFLLRELEEVDPKEGEDDALLAERKILVEAERLREAVSLAERELESGKESATERLGSSAKRLREAAAMDSSLEALANQVEAAWVEAQEAARSLLGYLRGLPSDPSRLGVVDDRLDALRRVARKHGGSVEAALERAKELRRELDGLSLAEERKEALGAEVETAAKTAVSLAKKLSSARRKAAARLTQEVQPALAALCLEGATFEVRFEEPLGGLVWDGVPLGPRGAEEVEFYFSANVGEEPKPLGKVASGGELSRVLLALKSVLATADPVGCYVFDEVDAGIGGAAAVSVGRMLQGASRERQVLCITHLPQVAAFADHHLQVSKKVDEGRTFSTVEALLDEPERRRGLARMLAGTEEATALAAAGDLLARSRREPPKSRRSHRRSRSLSPLRERILP